MKKLASFLPALLLATVYTPFVHADQRVFLDVAEVQAEFAKPIHRNPTEAELTVILPKSNDALLSASVSVNSPEDKEEWTGSFPLSSGYNACVLKDLGSLAPGRYMASVTIGETKMRRMLRIERIPAVQPPDEPIRLRKIFLHA